MKTPYVVTVVQDFVALTCVPKARAAYSSACTLGLAILSLAQKTARIAITYFLLFRSPTLFLAGAASAFFFPQQLNATMHRIQALWLNASLPIKACILCSMYYAWGSYAFIAAPLWGAYVILRAQKAADIDPMHDPV